jgi:hypothetical protein
MAVVTIVPFFKIPHKSLAFVSHDTQTSITGEKKINTNLINISLDTWQSPQLQCRL